MKEKKKFTSVDEILDLAKRKEQEASDFYKEWAGKVKNMSTKEILMELSGEELKHKDLILEVKNGKKLEKDTKKILDLKISNYIVEILPSEEMDYQDALITAMQREKNSFKLYKELASFTSDISLKNLFIALAQEEAKHKLRLETIYDDEIFKEE